MNDNDRKAEVEHKSDASRFEMNIEGNRCTLDYILDSDVVTMTSVRVPPPVEGRGIAGTLTRFALDHARTQGWSVVPRCPYVAAWIKRHPEYQDLLHT